MGSKLISTSEIKIQTQPRDLVKQTEEMVEESSMKCSQSAGDLNSHYLVKIIFQRENRSQRPKMCVECEVEKPDTKFGPGCKICIKCKGERQRKNQNQEAKMCVKCRVEKA